MRSLTIRVLLVVAGLATPLLASSCSSELQARCVKVTSRAELIGGPRALGEVGDYLLENGKVRFIVQDLGFSRGFGVFGGALLDADLVRPELGRGDSTGGRGHDNFGEMFPAFFLQALEPGEVNDPNKVKGRLPGIEIENPGGAGEDAVLVIRGEGNDFLALTETINTLVLGDDRALPRFLFETRYILKPGAQYVIIETTVMNVHPVDAAEFPNAEVFGAALPTPFGDVVLFGAGNKIFVPHEAGFDARFRLEDAYKAGDVTLPAFPGLVAEFVASASKEVSYGVTMFKPTDGVTNFAYTNRDQLPDATETSLHVPFIASAFTGVFQVLPPPVLAPSDGEKGGPDEMKFRRAFIVGDGDIASISDVVYALREQKTGELQGRISEDLVNRPVAGANVIVLDQNGEKVTQAATNEQGRFRANLPKGTYSLVVQKRGFKLTRKVEVKIEEGKTAFADLLLPASGNIVVTVVEPGVGRVPAKVTLLGTAPAEHAGEDPKDYLFDLSMGEPFRFTDLLPDDPDDDGTRQFIEEFDYGTDGVVHFRVPAGRYRVVAGRGIEYSRFEETIEVRAGQTVSVNAEIDRAIDTRGYIGADFHLHSVFSLDSSAKLEDRIASYAGEGVELAVSTDHNFVVDYQPTISKLNIEKFISSAVGLELTTIDRGHFNGFPLSVQPGALVAENEDGEWAATGIASRTHGSFQWAEKTPDEILTALRGLGRKDVNGKTLDVVVQVNHPRDSILGYFDVYALDPETLEVVGPSPPLGANPENHPEFAAEAFSFKFDAIEVFNGKRLDLLKTFTVPEDAPTLVIGPVGNRRTVTVDPVSCCEVQVGDVLYERAPFPCEDTIPGDCETCDATKFEAALDNGNCDGDATVAFPGAFEDWLRLLETGLNVVGTGNSDSHEPEKEEPGYPRTYIRSPTDEPQHLRPGVINDAFEARDVLMTNGPFLRVEVDGVGMGGMVAANSNGRSVLKIHVDSAPWVRVRTLNIYRGSLRVGSIPVTKSGPFDAQMEIETPLDTFLVVEATGTDGLFPSIYNNEIPPLQFTDVLGAIGGSFGLGGGDNALKPQLVTITTPYAATNPIYIDADGDGDWTPPRTLPALDAARRDERFELKDDAPLRTRPWVPTEREARMEEARALWQGMPLRKKVTLGRLPPWLWPSNDNRDIRRVLMQFVRHAD